MNLGALKAWAARRKPLLLGGGAAVAVALGLRARSKGGAPSPAVMTAPARGPSAAYDSTAADVVNHIQPQIDGLARRVEALGMQPAKAVKIINPAPSRPQAPPAPPPPPPPAQRAPLQTYTVARGDTLTAIARRFNLPAWQPLYDANRQVVGSNPNLIKPGQVLTIPK